MKMTHALFVTVLAVVAFEARAKTIDLLAPENKAFAEQYALNNRAMSMSPGDTPDNTRWAANYLCRQMTGFDSLDGREFNAQQPMSPGDFLRKMKEIIQETGWNPQEGKLSKEAIAQIAKKSQNDKIFADLVEAIETLPKESQRIIKKAQQRPDDINGYVAEDFRNLQMKDPEQAAKLAPVLHLLQPSANDNWLAGDAWRAMKCAFNDALVGVGDAAVNAVERLTVDGAECQRRREREAVWRQAFAPKRKEWFGLDRIIVDFAAFCGNIIHTASATVPFKYN